MSATGQGTTLIAGQNSAFIKAQTIPAAGTLVFTHSGATAPNGPGYAAYSVVVTQGDPAGGGVDLGCDLSVPFTQLVPPITVSQTADAITITNTTANPSVDIIIYAECKWLENSEELNLQSYPDAGGTIVIVPG